MLQSTENDRIILPFVICDFQYRVGDNVLRCDHLGHVFVKPTGSRSDGDAVFVDTFLSGTCDAKNFSSIRSGHCFLLEIHHQVLAALQGF